MRTTEFTEEKIRIRRAHLSFYFPTNVPQHYCSSTTPWPLEWFSNSAKKNLKNSQSQPALLCTSNPHLLPHHEAATRANDPKYTSWASKHGALDALKSNSEAKPTDMQPCQFSPKSQKVLYNLVPTFLSYIIIIGHHQLANMLKHKSTYTIH